MIVSCGDTNPHELLFSIIQAPNVKAMMNATRAVAILGFACPNLALVPSVMKVSSAVTTRFQFVQPLIPKLMHWFSLCRKRLRLRIGRLQLAIPLCRDQRRIDGRSMPLQH